MDGLGYRAHVFPGPSNKSGGLAVLVWRRPAFGLMSIAILVLGLYVWANYLELEHYLLVPWLILGIAAAVALDAIADGLAAGLSMVGRRVGPKVGLVVSGVAIVLAVLLGAMNWRAVLRTLTASTVA